MTVTIPTSRRMAGSLGKMPTTSVRRVTSRLSRSKGLLFQIGQNGNGGNPSFHYVDPAGGTNVWRDYSGQTFQVPNTGWASLDTSWNMMYQGYYGGCGSDAPGWADRHDELIVEGARAHWHDLAAATHCTTAARKSAQCRMKPMQPACRPHGSGDTGR